MTDVSEKAAPPKCQFSLKISFRIGRLMCITESTSMFASISAKKFHCCSMILLLLLMNGMDGPGCGSWSSDELI
jgi:hypothetical protein